MAKIAVISDFDMIGSGYHYIMAPLLSGLVKMGHEVKAAGLSYDGREHKYPFSIIPCKDVQDLVAVVNNLHYLWQPDVIIVGLDIPLQLAISETLRPLGRPYIAITPLENGPLTMSWAAGMFLMDYIFFISELGKQEALKAGLSKVDHLLVGVDTESWRPALPEEKKHIREGLGIAQDEFVVLSVADNQERKNLSAALEIISGLKKEIGEKKVRYLLVTREQSPFGWKLRDLAVKLDINKELNIYERGMSRDDLWGLYAVADAYLCSSKAEGLSLPVLDAMAMKLPCVATDTGALHELLDGARGWLIPPEYTIKSDVWGNERRDFIDVDVAIAALKAISYSPLSDVTNGLKAYEYIKSRTWGKACQQVDEVIRKLTNEPQA